jgi:hypothetical protein
MCTFSLSLSGQTSKYNGKLDKNCSSKNLFVC